MTSDSDTALLLLTLATLLLAAALTLARLKPHWPLWLHFAWRAVSFSVLTVIVQELIGSPLRPQYSPIGSGRDLWEHFVEAGWWIFAARLGVVLIRLLVVLEHRPRETQIVSDLMAGAIYIATLLAIVNFVFAVPIAGLLATSGVIAIVLGLALQNTFSDVFSGIAVGVEGPYKVGDLIWVEGNIEGHVVQVTWRSTHIATSQNTIAIIPNSVIAKARLINHSLPEPVRGDTLSIRLDAAIPPDQCVATLLTAVRACLLPLSTPAPTVACTGLQGDGAEYEINYSVASSALLEDARNEMLTEIHRHLRHAGIAVAGAGHPGPGRAEQPTAADILEQSDLFGVVGAESRKLMAEHFEPLWLQPNEVLFREGETPKHLFLVTAGVIEVTRQGISGSPQLVHRMSPGESLGALGFITGAPYQATATALTPAKLIRMDKTAMSAALAAAPSLATELEALAERSRVALERDSAAHERPHTEKPDELRFKLRNFLSLLKAA